jgi:hypothetical protein
MAKEKFDWCLVLQNACPTCLQEAGQPCVHRKHNFGKNTGRHPRAGTVRQVPHPERVELTTREAAA